MSLILIRQKARELQKRRRRQVFGTIVAPVCVAFFYTTCGKYLPHLPPMLHLLFVFALVWSVAGIYFLNRVKSPGEMPEDAGFSTGLEFCRQEIERQLSYLRRILLWSLGPILLTIGTLVAAVAVTTSIFPSIFPNGTPFLILLVVWTAVYLSIRTRQQRDLQRELDELREIEG